MEVTGANQNRQGVVDIFSHFSRLIDEGNTDIYMQAFEENNLLADFKNRHTQQLPPVTEQVTSLPIKTGYPEYPEVNVAENTTGGHVIDDASPLQKCLLETTSATLTGVFGSHSGLHSGKTTVNSPEVRKSGPAPKPKCYPFRPPMLPPCRVCGDAASGFHYGVNTCEACKGFFRRSIMKTTPTVCINSGNCKMFLGRRTSCSACRYKRCLEVGMSKHAIKTGRYTHELRSKNILEVKRLQREKSSEKSEMANAVTIIDTIVFKSEVLENCMQVKNCHSGLDWTKADEYSAVLDKLMEGQTCLYEFLDEYYDTDLMLQRQRAVYDRYLEDKRKRELLENFIKIENNRITFRLDQESVKDKTLVKDRVDALDNVKGESNGDTTYKYIDGNRMPHANDKMIGTLCQSSTLLDKDRMANAIDRVKDTEVLAGVTNISDENKIPNGNGRVDDNVLSLGLILEIRANLENYKDPDEEMKANVLSTFMEDMRRGVKGMLGFSREIPGFQELPNEDQVALVQAARFDIWFLGHIRCFNSELQTGACEWRFHADEMSKVWGEMLVQMTFNLSRIGKTMDLSKEETAALRGLCVTFTDRGFPLKNQEAAERVHEHMLSVLKYTVLKRHKNFNQWFTKAVRFLVNAREVAELYISISSNLKLEWSVLKNNPTLLEVFMS